MPAAEDPRKILKKAQEKGYAIGAFNTANLETLKAIEAAVEGLKAPAIVESSHGETKFIGGENLVDLVKNFREKSHLPVFINLDHAPTLEVAREGMAAGYELIHINASNLPYEENIKVTAQVAKEAHRKGLLVEAELTPIVGTSAPHMQERVEEEQAKSRYTDPDQAADFVAKTKIDTLAVAVGNIHGVYKTAPKLDLDLLGILRDRLPCFFSLHGGSGIPDDQIRKAIKIGKIVKINVNSEMRIAYRETLEKVLKKSEEVAIYKIMPDVIEAVRKVVEKKIKLFGCASKA